MVVSSCSARRRLRLAGQRMVPSRQRVRARVAPLLCSCGGGGGVGVVFTSTTSTSESLSLSSSDEEDSSEEAAAPPAAEKNRDIRLRLSAARRLALVATWKAALLVFGRNLEG